jgi:hypothetical protein
MAEIFDRSMEQIRQNRLRRINGLVNTIPFGMPRFQQFIPGIQKKKYVIVTASSGIGKSIGTKYLYVISAVNFVHAHPEMGMKLKIFYFCLEESKEAFIQSIKCYKLYEVYGLRIDINELNSQTGILAEDIEEKLVALQPWFDMFEQTVEIIDTIRKPYPIYRHVVDYLEQPEIGSWTYKELIRKDKDEQGNETQKVMKVRHFYNPVHPDTYVLVVTDHLSLLQPEKGMKNKHEAITMFSSEYCIALRDKYYCTVVNVQQQSAEQEKKQFTYKGQSIESKLEPSLDGLADNKLTQRDADQVLGIFAPDRYEIDEHKGYNIRILEDNYRSLSVLKNRSGPSNLRIGCFFDGAVNYLEELPKKDDMRPEHYDTLLRRVGRLTQGPPPRQSIDTPLDGGRTFAFRSSNNTREDG